MISGLFDWPDMTTRMEFGIQPAVHRVAAPANWPGASDGDPLLDGARLVVAQGGGREVNKRFGLSVIRMLLAVSVAIAVLLPSFAAPAGVAAEPAFQRKPSSGPPGTKVKVTVTGVPPGEELTVEADGKPVCSFVSGNSGKGGCTFKAPKGSKKVTITIKGPNVGQADLAPFTVTKDDKDNGGNDSGGGNNGGNRGGKRGGAGDRGLVPIPAPPNIRVPRSNCDARCQYQLRLAERGVKEINCVTFGVNDCLELIFGTNPLPAGAQRAIESVQCTIEIASAIITFGADTPLLAISGCGDLISRQTPLPQPPLEVAPELPLDECFPAQVGTVTDCAESPRFEPASVPFDLPEQVEAPPTFGDILDSLDSVPAAPSASLVQEQQDEIRAGVCANVPAGAGGCP